MPDTITIADGGMAALVGPNVTNDGLIQAKLGKVELGSGDTFTLDLYGDGLINLQASPAITQQLVQQQRHRSHADGGKVLMTAAAAQNTVNSLINMNGVIVRPTASASKHGEIDALCRGQQRGGRTTSRPTRDRKGQQHGAGLGHARAPAAQSPARQGGNISVLGDNVGILSGAVIDASGDTGGGTIKIGGDFHGAGQHAHRAEHLR